jgi:hypothetical protein
MDIKSKFLNAVKTARVASLSGLKTLSFPHPVRFL